MKTSVEMSRASLLYVQVLFCYEQFDELTLLHLREFDKKKMISAETDIVVDHYKEEKFEETKPGLFRSCFQQCSRISVTVTSVVLTPVFLSSSAASERLTQEQADDLISWMKNSLGPRVTNIKVKIRLYSRPQMCLPHQFSHEFKSFCDDFFFISEDLMMVSFNVQLA